MEKTKTEVSAWQPAPASEPLSGSLANVIYDPTPDAQMLADFDRRDRDGSRCNA